jgi:hypothetical protein
MARFASRLGSFTRQGGAMRRIVFLMFALALLEAACGSTDELQDQSSSTATSGGGTPASGSTASEVPVADPIRGCVPSCNTPGLTRPGPLPLGPYETQWFFGGEMVITLDEPCSSHEDSTGEFVLTLDATPENGVYFWEDVYPVENEERVPGVPMTVDGFLDWLRQTPRLDVSAARPGTIGSDLPATVVDVTVSKDATNEDVACPSATCVLWLGFPQWEGSWGIAVPQAQRFYLSDVTYGGKTHLFVAVVYPDDPLDMETFLPHGEDLIATVEVPATPA